MGIFQFLGIDLVSYYSLAVANLKLLPFYCQK